jgi:hypothetical protein
MLRGTDRIMTTHAGALPRADALRALVFARSNGEPYDKAGLATSLRDAVAQTVAKQVELGIDSVNDGELGKSNFTNYIHERLAGIEKRPYKPGQDTGFTSLIRRDAGAGFCFMSPNNSRCLSGGQTAQHRLRRSFDVRRP